MICNSIVIVNAGQRGVLLTWGAVTDVRQEGLSFKIPFAQSVKSIDVKTVKLEVEALAYSKDIQTVNSKIALNYHLLPESVGTLYKEIGKDFENRIIAPAIQEAVKAVSAKYTAQELIEKRGEVKEGIKTQLTERLLSRNMIVDEVSIINFDFSLAFEQAVEAKQVAQQDALKAQNKLEQVKFEADQRVAQAQAEAEAIKIQAEAITQQGGEDYVNLKAVEKWNGVLPIQMIPNATMPFINLTK
jgi:regulator of protease activity HflC (stomatin/prohibitin superfamily)